MLQSATGTAKFISANIFISAVWDQTAKFNDRQYFQLYGMPSSYLSDNDSSSLAVDAEGQMARFVTKTLRVCSGLVVLTYCT